MSVKLSTQTLTAASARHPWQTNEDPAFDVSIAGAWALDHDFNLLSQEDLEKGELQFGLPAALIEWNWYLPR